MTEIYGLPQPLTGAETVTIHQMQNGQLAKCSMPISQFVAYFSAFIAALPTTAPAAPGALWNDSGVVSIIG